MAILTTARATTCYRVFVGAVTGAFLGSRKIASPMVCRPQYVLADAGHHQNDLGAEPNQPVRKP